MNIILTGSTGFIGSEVLRQCLADPKIIPVTVLSRRSLQTAHAKLNVLIIKDFPKLEEEEGVVEALSKADGCIWAMGTTAAEPVLEIEYPMAFADAALRTFAQHERSDAENKRFRYVHLSGKYAERDQEKSLWFLSEGRKFKGLAETKLLHVAEQSGKKWETYIARPDLVLSRTSFLAQLASKVLGSQQIWVQDLAAAMIDVVVSGSQELIMENKVLSKKGIEVNGGRGRD
ncbi:hypothetical protein PVAG01_09908 [Phlyctema vagabunda]|uniref:NAD(P)-binding domain-containing protein n=1 Tax=Phlyctema vagabunda TaxID=108571 RepID=A0ABR4P4I1_9HELO